jgi:hypothetical protein
MQFQFGSVTGPFCGWLQVDDGTLAAEAARLGWECEVIGRGAHGDYLATLTRPPALAAR